MWDAQEDSTTDPNYTTDFVNGDISTANMSCTNSCGLRGAMRPEIKKPLALTVGAFVAGFGFAGLWHATHAARQTFAVAPRLGVVAHLPGDPPNDPFLGGKNYGTDVGAATAAAGVPIVRPNTPLVNDGMITAIWVAHQGSDSGSDVVQIHLDYSSGLTVEEESDPTGNSLQAWQADLQTWDDHTYGQAQLVTVGGQTGILVPGDTVRFGATNGPDAPPAVSNPPEHNAAMVRFNSGGLYVRMWGFFSDADILAIAQSTAPPPKLPTG